MEQEILSLKHYYHLMNSLLFCFKFKISFSHCLVAISPINISNIIYIGIIIHFISMIIPQTSLPDLIGQFSLYCNWLYISIAISRSSVLPLDVLLIWYAWPIWNITVIGYLFISYVYIISAFNSSLSFHHNIYIAIVTQI